MKFQMYALAIIMMSTTFARGQSLEIVGDNGNPFKTFPLGLCQGDCDNHDQCFGDLNCFMRTGFQSVPGCNGVGQYGKDYCFNPQKANALTFLANKDKHPESYPLVQCQGQCDTDADCIGSLKCFKRTGTQTVPGCSGSGVNGKSYCYSPNNLVSTPSLRPTNAPANPTVNISRNITYIPGQLTVSKAGLRLSAGLDVRMIAKKYQPVKYDKGGQSAINFHVDPDAAGVFPKNDGSGNYYYVSNSESNVTGGVGSIEFDSKGNVLGYKNVLSGTKRNCGGGRSPYNTWLSAEENNKSGFVWEVSPGGKFAGKRTNLVTEGGNYESVAYHFDQTLGRHVYYTTEDSPTGPLVQFIPSANLGTSGEMYSQGTHRYLNIDKGNFGTFSWVDSKANATPQRYPNAEGIDVKDGFLYFVSKVDKTLFILNLAAGIFSRESTHQGAFNNQPDQVTRLIGVDPHNILYFCEDGSTNCGVHGRTTKGKYITIMDIDPKVNTLYGETTGLAFSPDGRRMYVSYQKPGIIFEIWRTDGFSFAGDFIDIKYHSV